MSGDRPHGPRTEPEVAYNVVGEKIGDDREQLLNFRIDEQLEQVAEPSSGNVVLAKIDDLFRWSQL